MRRPEPTQEELRAAWQRCRNSTWPRTYEEAMADALLSRMVRISAMHPPRAQRMPAAPVRTRLLDPKPRPRDTSSRPLPGVRPGDFDRKRAAAGERDDD